MAALARKQRCAAKALHPTRGSARRADVNAPPLRQPAAVTTESSKEPTRARRAATMRLSDRIHPSSSRQVRRQWWITVCGCMAHTRGLTHAHPRSRVTTLLVRATVDSMAKAALGRHGTGGTAGACVCAGGAASACCRWTVASPTHPCGSVLRCNAHRTSTCLHRLARCWHLGAQPGSQVRAAGRCCTGAITAAAHVQSLYGSRDVHVADVAHGPRRSAAAAPGTPGTAAPTVAAQLAADTSAAVLPRQARAVLPPLRPQVARTHVLVRNCNAAHPLCSQQRRVVRCAYRHAPHVCSRPHRPPHLQRHSVTLPRLTLPARRHSPATALAPRLAPAGAGASALRASLEHERGAGPPGAGGPAALSLPTLGSAAPQLAAADGPGSRTWPGVHRPVPRYARDPHSVPGSDDSNAYARSTRSTHALSAAMRRVRARSGAAARPPWAAQAARDAVESVARSRRPSGATLSECDSECDSECGSDCDSESDSGSDSPADFPDTVHVTHVHVHETMYIHFMDANGAIAHTRTLELDDSGQWREVGSRASTPDGEDKDAAQRGDSGARRARAGAPNDRQPGRAHGSHGDSRGRARLPAENGGQRDQAHGRGHGRYRYGRGGPR